MSGSGPSGTHPPGLGWQSARPLTHPPAHPSLSTTNAAHQGKAQPAGSSGLGRQIMAPSSCQLHAIRTRLACGRSTTFSRGAHCTRPSNSHWQFCDSQNSVPGFRLLVPSHHLTPAARYHSFVRLPCSRSSSLKSSTHTRHPDGLTTTAASHQLLNLLSSPGPRHPTVPGESRVQTKKNQPIACGAHTGFCLHLQYGNTGVPDSGVRTSEQVA
jgi:hypothetical protein